MEARYHVDLGQARRVADMAARLHAQCAESWQLESELAGLALGWAARLHEIGLDISHDGFHRHGAYVAEWADMPGFPRAEQRLMAFLIGSQRNAIDTARLKTLPRAWRDSALRLAILLRLAVLLNRSRKELIHPPVTIQVNENSIRIGFDAEWLATNPLTIADLEGEQGYLDNVGYKLELL